MADITKLNEKEVQETSSLGSDVKKLLIRNSVTILFAIICLGGIYFSKLPLFFIVNELLTRFTRNTFLVLALIIPVVAGMGLNFSIVIGGMAGQAAIIIVTYMGVTGLPGFLLCIAIAVPIAIGLGIMTGRLLNKTRGQEMIASMISGFFANGIYQFIFLVMIGTVIPFTNKVMLKPDGIGLRNTIDLSGGRDADGIKYALDSLIKWPLFTVGFVIFLAGASYCAYKLYKIKKGTTHFNKIEAIFNLVLTLIGTGLCAYMVFNPNLPLKLKMLSNIKLSVMSAVALFIICIFNTIFLRTKLGQDMRSCGHDQHIAQVSGINVDKTRVIAITISMVLAAWGQIIFLQNMGVLNTYGSHVQIGLFSVAAILIGGASVSKATVRQALLGVILLHTLFIVSPKAGQELLGDAQIGELFRSFVAYGVIGVALGLHAWKQVAAKAK